MSWKRDNPGCPCCGCVADTDHICLCGCPTPFSRTAHVGDDNGTHAIIAVPPSGSFRGECTQAGVTLYGTKGGFIRPCLVVTSTTLHYAYVLRCESVGGVLKWILQLFAPAQDCFGTWNYADAGTAGSPFMDDRVDATCDGLLTFSFPSTFHVSGVDTGLPTPGGGGTITVVLDD